MSFEKLPFEFLPTVDQPVTRHNFAKLAFVNGIGFDELKHARFILAASGLQGEGGKVFGGEDARANGINIFLDSFGQSFFEQRTLAWKKLNRPIGDNHVLTFGRAAFGP